MSQDRNTQLSNLRAAFPSCTTIQETSTELLLKVDHSIKLSAATVYDLTLFIKLPASFPKSAPVATMPYCFHQVPITPPNINPTELPAYQWDPKGSTLLEAVRNAFQHAADRWGPIAPPTMSAVAVQLASETDRLLQDISTNPNCLDAYCYQMPMIKAMRDASRQTIAEVERVANENVSLRPDVEKLEKEVRRMQEQLGNEVEKLQSVSSNSLLVSVASSDALLRTLDDDVCTLSTECTQLGKKALGAYSTDRKSFQKALDEYRARAKLMHTVDLKRRAYRTQLQ